MTNPNGQSGGVDAGDEVTNTYNGSGQVTEQVDPAGRPPTSPTAGTTCLPLGVRPPSPTQQRCHRRGLPERRAHLADPGLWTAAAATTLYDYGDATLGPPRSSTPTATHHLHLRLGRRRPDQDRRPGQHLDLYLQLVRRGPHLPDPRPGRRQCGDYRRLQQRRRPHGHRHHAARRWLCHYHLHLRELGRARRCHRRRRPRWQHHALQLRPRWGPDRGGRPPGPAHHLYLQRARAADGGGLAKDNAALSPSVPGDIYTVAGTDASLYAPDGVAVDSAATSTSPTTATTGSGRSPPPPAPSGASP